MRNVIIININRWYIDGIVLILNHIRQNKFDKIVASPSTREIKR